MDAKRTYRICLCCLAFLLTYSSQAQDMDVTDFAREIHFEGIPYEVANSYDASDAPALLAMLDNPEDSPYWANAIVTLCIIGDPSYVDRVLQFIREDEGTLSDDLYRAKSSAVMALGYLVNKSGNQKALDYLIASTDPNAWSQREVGYVGPFQANVDARNANLSTMAILGLALSGHPSAAEALRNIAPSNFKPMTTDEVSSMAESALDAYQQIAADGLAAYYQKARGGP